MKLAGGRGIVASSQLETELLFRQQIRKACQATCTVQAQKRRRRRRLRQGSGGGWQERNCTGNWVDHAVAAGFSVVHKGRSFVALTGPGLTEGVDESRLTANALWEAVTGRPGAQT